MLAIHHPILPFEDLPQQVRPQRSPNPDSPMVDPLARSKALHKNTAEIPTQDELFSWHQSVDETVKQHLKCMSLDLDLVNHITYCEMERIAEIIHANIKSVISKRRCVSDEVVQFENLVPKSKHFLLDYNVMSWAQRIPKLRKLSYELDDIDKTKLGDVVKMTEDEIRAQTSATERTVVVLKEELAAIGLKLGMLTPGWTPATRRPAAGRW